MSSTASHIIQLVKSLPEGDQRIICQALVKRASEFGLLVSGTDREQPNFSPEDYEGIDNDDPLFKALEEIEAERHRTPGRPPVRLD
jgi:hypothetical protein